jgi:hypothetical protein
MKRRGDATLLHDDGEGDDEPEPIILPHDTISDSPEPMTSVGEDDISGSPKSRLGSSKPASLSQTSLSSPRMQSVV